MGLVTQFLLHRETLLHSGRSGAEESRTIQFQVAFKTWDCVTYIEHGSKNRSGGIDHLRLENKEVPCYAVYDQVPKCLVFLLNLYMKKLPKYAFVAPIFMSSLASSTSAGASASYNSTPPSPVFTLKSVIQK